MYKIEYDKKYRKEKLKQKSVWFTKDEAERIENYCKQRNVTFSELVKRLVAEEQGRENARTVNSASAPTRTATKGAGTVVYLI